MTFRIGRARTACVALALAAAAGTAWAQDGHPQVHRQGEISYVSGGVGQEESTWFKSVSGDYNLRLQFALSDGGAYVSDVEVRVKGASGQEVLSAKSDGPIFYAKLPEGSYDVTVTYGGKPQSRKMDVGAKGGAAQGFYWKGPT
ncbi:carboxypeptidase regulatory-like domain-containing protein [Bordetella genomosp. 13]|uniref:carboxypeptidase regulatory-like domain-containing protein n=1 Tax=Bordetella genomosp. 13 TaxID=463040 RepID=UPI00119F4BB5|nr:carboxypeptidase regulatory-like domain-containing protein [Bordetella genomosp. 13]